MNPPSLFDSLVRAVARAVALFALASGCLSRPVYKCTTIAQCVSEQAEHGVCENSGACTFPDNTCPGTRRRYPDGAGALADKCLDPPKNPCIAQLSGGEEHFCLLKTDGTAWCWGSNDHGEIGNNAKTDAKIPTQARLPSATKYTSVSAGQESTCALASDGAVYCWGGNDVGVVGVAKGWTTDANGNDVPAYDVGDIMAPAQLTLVLVPDPSGKLKKTPAPKFKAVNVGGKHACAIGEAGDMYCWGENAADQCGYDHLKAPGWDDVAVPLQVAGATGIVAISLGDEHTQVLRDDGSLFAFGDNTYGELGNGMKGGTSFTPVKVNITSVKAIASGDEHVCAMKNDGSVWCWGYGASGALGTGNTQDLTQPQRVASAQLVASGGNAFHTCAITTGQALQCWGQNSSGEAGTGNISEGLGASVTTPTTAMLPTVTMVAPANAATCAVTTDDVLWCWGQNKRGQLADPDASSGAPYPEPRRAKFTCP